jgi:hypothetical protein
MVPRSQVVRTLFAVAVLTSSFTALAQSPERRAAPLPAQAEQQQLDAVSSDGVSSRGEVPLPKRTTLGLKVDVSDTGNVSGSFTAGTETIYFEVLRGEPLDSGDPDAPPYALDIRIMDHDRTPFVLQTSGAGPISPTWFADSLTAESQPVDVDARQRALALFPRTARALSAYLDEHADAYVEVGALIELLNFHTIDQLFDFDREPQSPITTQATTTTTYKHKVTINKKRSNINLPNREYEHSALILQIYDKSGKYVGGWYTSNHGTAATSSLMTFQCSNSFTKTNVSFNMWDIMCESYSSVWPATHLCNNDTRQEYLSIKNSQAKNWGVCFGWAKYAPNCD